MILRDFGFVSREELRRGTLAQADVAAAARRRSRASCSRSSRSTPTRWSSSTRRRACRPTVLDQIRLLTAFEHEGQRLVQVVLVGQPMLLSTLKTEPMYALNERITRRVMLTPLHAAGGRRLHPAPPASRRRHRALDVSRPKRPARRGPVTRAAAADQRALRPRAAGRPRRGQQHHHARHREAGRALARRRARRRRTTTRSSRRRGRSRRRSSSRITRRRSRWAAWPSPRRADARKRLCRGRRGAGGDRRSRLAATTPSRSSAAIPVFRSHPRRRRSISAARAEARPDATPSCRRGSTRTRRPAAAGKRGDSTAWLPRPSSQTIATSSTETPPRLGPIVDGLGRILLRHHSAALRAREPAVEVLGPAREALHLHRAVGSGR